MGRMGETKVGDDGECRHGRALHLRQIQRRGIRENILMQNTLMQALLLPRRESLFFFLTGVSKSFPGVRALHDVSFTLRAGEVTALVGENGAGKSTIVKILTGIYSPDAGEITVGGQLRKFQSPRDSWAAGIAAIHQETVMFDELSVAENIFMGHMPRPSKLVDWPQMRQRTAELLKRIDARF